jgi:hypothetical protein
MGSSFSLSDNCIGNQFNIKMDMEEDSAQEKKDKTETILQDNVNNLFNTIKFDHNDDIFKLYDYDYALFISGTFSNKFFCLKKELYQFFSTNNIACLNHNEKNNITTLIKVYNSRIKDKKYKIIKQNTENNKVEMQLFIHKPIFFYNNTIDANVLYKKICFAKKEIFIPFDLYVLKKMEYKIKNFCQITEKLGVEKIRITYNAASIKDESVRLNVQSCNVDVGGNIADNIKNSDELSIVLEYPKKNQNYAINLDKYDLIKKIDEENTFFISSEEYKADIDLQYLIDSRCDNFITNYNTTFKISRINEFEQSIFATANYYGLELSSKCDINEFIEITISIRFINVYDNVESIDGTNINPEKYGFMHLCNFIREEMSQTKNRIYPFMKIKKFLFRHIYAIQNNCIYTKLELQNDHKSRIINLYNDIMVPNFSDKEMNDLLYTYFNNDLTYGTFTKFRNAIILGINNYNYILSTTDLITTKFYFNCFQVHDIHKQQLLLINKMKQQVKNKYEEYQEKKKIGSIKSPKKMLSIIAPNNMDNELDMIQKIMEYAITRSYYYKHGIAYCKEEMPELIHEIDNNDMIHESISIFNYKSDVNTNYYDSEDDVDKESDDMENDKESDNMEETSDEENKSVGKIEIEMTVNPLCDKKEVSNDDTTESDKSVQNVVNTIQSIVLKKYSLEIKEMKMSKEEFLKFIEEVIIELIEYLDNKIIDYNNYDSCSYEVNGIYTVTRIVDMVRDLAYMCFNEFNVYDHFNVLRPNKNKYNKELIEHFTGKRIQEIILHGFYKKYKIEKLFSNYSFYKVYFTFNDFENFINYIDMIFGNLADKAKEKNITKETFINNDEFLYNSENADTYDIMKKYHESAEIDNNIHMNNSDESNELEDIHK